MHHTIPFQTLHHSSSSSSSFIGKGKGKGKGKGNGKGRETEKKNSGKMPLSFAGSVSGGISIIPYHFASEPTVATGKGMLSFPSLLHGACLAKKAAFFSPKALLSGADTDKADVFEDKSASSTIDHVKQARRSADWKAAQVYKERGLIFEGRVEDFNNGGMLIRFYSLVGFLPYPQLSPSHSCREPNKPIQEVAEGLTGTAVSVKVIVSDEENKKLIFSEKEASWTKYSQKVNIGDVFQARVGSIEDYGAFVHLKFPDGNYHLTGLVHVSEVSWDLVQDVRDILTEGDEVKVKVTNIDREKARITLSMKQLEEDPLLETLEKVIPQNDSFVSDDTNQGYEIKPLPGLETIFQEIIQEEGIDGVKISRQGFEKRVVSQDLQLWLSNVPPIGNQFTLLARAGRQVQEIHLTTSLDQEGIKTALQRVLERVP